MTDRPSTPSPKHGPSLARRLRCLIAAQLIALAVVFGMPAVLGLPAAAALAATTADGIKYEQQEPGTIAITGYEGAGGRVEIPAQLEGLPVTSIADGAFSLNANLTEVSVPEGVLSIGCEAFNDCIKLTSVELPASLSSIGDSAFYSCGRLTGIELPYGLASIGDGAFYGCESLTSIDIPGTVSDWGDYTFSSCEGLQSVKIGEGVDRVPTRSFIRNKLLTSVELPSSVKVIEKSAFRDCFALASCDLSHVEEIGESAFSQAGGLESADLTSALRVGNKAFLYCIKLAHADFGCVQSIGKEAFSSSGLESVTLPATCEEIGDGAFSSCNNLASVEVDPQNPSYMSDAGVLYSKDGSELLLIPTHLDLAASGGVFTVPDTVRGIGLSAAKGNLTIEKLVLPEGLTELGESAFSEVSNLRDVSFPSTLQEIPDRAFYSDSSLESIAIPGTVKSIGSWAFGASLGLENVSLGEGVEKIGSYAFAQDGLARLDLPASLTSIDPTVFANCQKAPRVTLAPGNPAFLLANDGVSLLSSDGETLVAVFGFDDYQGAYSIPDGVETIAPSAGCLITAKSVTVPDSVTTIGDKGLGYSDYGITGNYDSAPGIYGSESNEALLAYARKTGLAFFTQEPQQSATEITLSVGEKANFSLTGAPAGLLTFASSDNSVATVDAQGQIAGIAGGEADVFACVGNKYFSVHVTVEGPAASDPYVGYARITTEKDVEPWEKAYAEYNNGDIQREDVPNIYTYTTNAYTAMNAFLIGGRYIEKADEMFGPGQYEEYRLAATDACDELLRNQIHTDTVLYSGVGNVSYITGTGNTVADMVASIGKEYATTGIMSTSLLQSVASQFAKGSKGTVLEIYAPKGKTLGTYVSAASAFKEEYEVTFPKGQRFRVVDAGVRWYEYDTSEDEGEGAGHHKEIQKYMKVEVLGNEPTPDPDPDPDPTPEPDPTPDPDPSPEPDSEPDSTPDSDATMKTSSIKKGKGNIPSTGEEDTNWAFIMLSGLFLAVSGWVSRRFV